MECNRKHESGPIPFRSGRYFNVAGEWFFASREGIDHGPYRSRDEAAKALADFLGDITTVEKFNRRYAGT